MCLLAILSRVHADCPLVVAANRDEWLSRPAGDMQVLRSGTPRILGGRDELAGGTWLAVNEHGVVAGLTNRPQAQGRDPSKRSRGELPLMLAASATAEQAVLSFVAKVRPQDYNPCWLLVADRDGAYYLELTQGDAPTLLELPPGIHVLENLPLTAASPKAAWVRAALAPAVDWHGEALVSGLANVVKSHHVPDAPASDPQGQGLVRPRETLAACVHAGAYGTRSAAMVLVPPSPTHRPVVRAAGGPPCTSEFVDRSSLWSFSAPSS